MFNTLKSAMNRVSTAFRPPPWGPMAPMYRMSLRVWTVEVERVRVRVGVVAEVRERVAERVGVKVRGIVRVRGSIKSRSGSESRSESRSKSEGRSKRVKVRVRGRVEKNN